MYGEKLTQNQTDWASSRLEEDDAQPLLAGVRDGRASSATAALSNQPGPGPWAFLITLGLDAAWRPSHPAGIRMSRLARAR